MQTHLDFFQWNRMLLNTDLSLCNKLIRPTCKRNFRAKAYLSPVTVSNSDTVTCKWAPVVVAIIKLIGCIGLRDLKHVLWLLAFILKVTVYIKRVYFVNVKPCKITQTNIQLSTRCYYKAWVQYSHELRNLLYHTPRPIKIQQILDSSTGWCKKIQWKMVAFLILKLARWLNDRYFFKICIETICPILINAFI